MFVMFERSGSNSLLVALFVAVAEVTQDSGRVDIY
jgi:hypothetical protein